MARKYGRQNLKLVTSDEHFISLSVSRETVSEKTFIVHRHQIGAHVKWFVQKFKICHIVADSCVFDIVQIGFPFREIRSKLIVNENLKFWENY